MFNCLQSNILNRVEISLFTVKSTFKQFNRLSILQLTMKQVSPIFENYCQALFWQQKLLLDIFVKKAFRANDGCESSKWKYNWKYWTRGWDRLRRVMVPPSIVLFPPFVSSFSSWEKWDWYFALRRANNKTRVRTARPGAPCTRACEGRLYELRV